jgi:HPt (histidine-containing phosphotransfer) domain-containing protein
MQDLRACLLRGDAAAATRIVHSMRGAAATLGAQALAQAARAVETRLRETPEPPASELAEAVAALSLQVNRLPKLIGAGGPPEAPAPGLDGPPGAPHGVPVTT